MRIVFNKKSKNIAVLLAETAEDATVLRAFYDNHIIFGLYQVWFKDAEGRGEKRPEIKPFLTKLPNLWGIGWLNLVKGFVPTKIIN